MFYVYILQSQKDRNYYTGVTENLSGRLNAHNWHTVKTTKSKTPYEIVWFCAFLDKNKALDFEKYLKSGSGIAFRNKHLI